MFQRSSILVDEFKQGDFAECVYTGCSHVRSRSAVSVWIGGSISYFSFQSVRTRFYVRWIRLQPSSPL